jgi:hypothetical protein
LSRFATVNCRIAKSQFGHIVGVDQRHWTSKSAMCCYSDRSGGAKLC